MEQLKINGKAVIEREQSETGFDSAEREQARPVIRGKAIYATKGAAREYGRIGCNFYKGCPNDCTYCYLKRGAPSKQLGGSQAKLKKCFRNEEHAVEVLCKEFDKWLEPCRKFGIFLSFTTDPMIEQTRYLTKQAIIKATVRGIPTYVLTKDASFINHIKTFRFLETLPEPYRKLIHFGFTLTGRDDMEPNASSNEDRIKAMQYMFVLGYPTFASLEPVISWDDTIKMVLEALLYCDHFKLGLRSGVKKDYYDPAESIDAIKCIVQTVNLFNKTIYLKESTRLLLQQHLRSGAYEAVLSHTVDQNGNPID